MILVVVVSYLIPRIIGPSSKLHNDIMKGSVRVTRTWTKGTHFRAYQNVGKI